MKTKKIIEIAKRRGKDYLYPVYPADPVTRGEKCDCKNTNGPSGRWLVECPVTKKIYGIDPATQIQKDIWLGAAKDQAEKEERIGMLKWFCFTCGTVQAP